MRLEVFIESLESTDEVIITRQGKQGTYYIGPACHTPCNLYDRAVLEIIFNEESIAIVVD